MSYAPFIISLLAFIVIVLGVMIWGTIHRPSEYELHELTGRLMLISFVITVANMILVYNIRSKFITIPDEDENYWLFFIITKNCEQIKITKPIWRTGKEYFVSNPYRHNNESKLETAATTIIKSRYKNITLALTVNITLILDTKFDELKLFNLLHNYFQGDKHYSVENYIKDVFRNLNVSNQAALDEITGRYIQKLISEPELLDEFVEKIIFPERLFENVIDTKICIHDPSFSSCKGMICGS